MINERFPKDLRVALAVTGFRANIVVKRPLLEALFNIVPVARAKAEPLEHESASWMDSASGLREALENPDNKHKVWEASANRALFTDAASALMLIVASELERLFRETSVSLFNRGESTYAPNICVARAVWSLANQYKHLGEWRQNPDQSRADKAIVRTLVDDEMRADAAAEFLKRGGYREYHLFENALISCSDNIVGDGSIPASGRAGMPVVTMTSVP